MSAPFDGTKSNASIRFRVLRHQRQPRSTNVRAYKLLVPLAPKLETWVELDRDSTGWGIFESAGLSKQDLERLWHDEEIELQENSGGVWKDVFTITYPDR